MAPTRPSRLWALPCALLCCGAAAVVVIAQRDGLEEAIRSYHWPSTEGVLLTAERGRARYGTSYDNATEEVWVALAYAYTSSDGQPLAGHRFDVSTAPGPGWRHRYSMVACNIARQAAREAPAVRVYYDPERPGSAVLMPGIATSQGGWLALVVTFLGAALSFLRFAVRTPPKPGFGQTQEQFGPGLVGWALGVPFGWLILAFGLGAVWYSAGGGVPPTAPALAYLALCLLLILFPRLAVSKLAQKPIAGLIIGLLLLGLWGAVLAAKDAKAEVEYTIPEATLLDYLVHSHPRVREHAADEILARKGPAEAGPALRVLLDDPDPEVREAARGALRALGLR